MKATRKSDTSKFTWLHYCVGKREKASDSLLHPRWHSHLLHAHRVCSLEEVNGSPKLLSLPLPCHCLRAAVLGDFSNGTRGWHALMRKPINSREITFQRTLMSRCELRFLDASTLWNPKSSLSSSFEKLLREFNRNEEDALEGLPPLTASLICIIHLFAFRWAPRQEQFIVFVWSTKPESASLRFLPLDTLRAFCCLNLSVSNLNGNKTKCAMLFRSEKFGA